MTTIHKPPESGGADRRAAPLPTFEQVRHRAYADLGGVLDTLRSDVQAHQRPSISQREALAEARRHLHAAREALNQAA